MADARADTSALASRIFLTARSAAPTKASIAPESAIFFSMSLRVLSKLAASAMVCLLHDGDVGVGAIRADRFSGSRRGASSERGVDLQQHLLLSFGQVRVVQYGGLHGLAAALVRVEDPRPDV